MLSVKNLHKEFKNVIAVNDVSFNVEPGRIFGILGPNGAGKTTTIRCLLDIIKPDRGEIHFNGEIADENFRNKVGYLPEERGLYSKSRVIDVLCYFGELRGLSHSEAKNQAIHFLKKLEISNYAGKKVNELSKGNQQKIQFVAAVINNPTILILDEPFAGLDPINQQLIKNLIQEFLDDGRIILLSTHQMEVAEKLCSQILLINKGEEILKGKLSEIKKNFGKISLVIKSTQIGNDIQSFPEVSSADVYENYSEVVLKTGVDSQTLLRKLIEKYEITGFDIKEPSLNSIFIEAVSNANKLSGEKR
ncbi:MAG: ATP-binding cassette domain-containing protein [Bacteroidetes bacterium]|nr:ATP-binding cassette domain-containing protein [Bacteroidota bacterium]MBU2584214.1 ATP-binding cassette domain-containing protein [Bacteroidota bacterium]